MIQRKKMKYISVMAAKLRRKRKEIVKVLGRKSISLKPKQKIFDPLQGSQCTFKEVRTYRIRFYDRSRILCELNTREPLKLTKNNSIFSQLVPDVSYKTPEVAKVIISKHHKTSDRFHADFAQVIPFEDEDKQQAAFSIIPFDTFLKYDGKFDLSIAQMKLQQESVSLPPYVKDYFQNNRIEAINLWYNKGEKISTWHYDGHDNFLFVLEGQKTIYLAPPNNFDSSLLKDNGNYLKSKNVFNENANHAQTKQFLDFFENEEGVLKAEMLKGQCLFIPRGWWHYVRSEGKPNIAINVWGNSLKDLVDTNEEQIMLKHLIFNISDRLARQTHQWQQMSQQWKQKYRQAYFMLYFNRYLQGKSVSQQ